MPKEKLNRKFGQIVILDPIILTPSQWAALGDLTESLYYFSRQDETKLGNRQNKIRLTNLTELNKLDRDRMNNILQKSDAIITCWTHIRDDLILSNSRLCYVGFWTHCVDGKINLKLAEKKGITVTHIPNYGTDAVAEMTIAGVLAIHRKILKITRDTLNGNWPYEYLKTGSHIPDIDEIPASSLTGRLLGIVGFGRIGQRVAEIAQAFNMRVQYYSTSRHFEWESRGVRFAELNELFSGSDVVSIHLPQNAPPKMINAELIRKMKDRSIFVNTGAGRVVDQEALLEEIRSRRIYAYLDVYESLPPRSKLKELDALNNLFSYRAAWFTKECIASKGDLLIRNIEDYIITKKEAIYVEKS